MSVVRVSALVTATQVPETDFRCLETAPATEEAKDDRKCWSLRSLGLCNLNITKQKYSALWASDGGVPNAILNCHDRRLVPLASLVDSPRSTSSIDTMWCCCDSLHASCAELLHVGPLTFAFLGPLLAESRC